MVEVGKEYKLKWTMKVAAGLDQIGGVVGLVVSSHLREEMRVVEHYRKDEDEQPG